MADYTELKPILTKLRGSTFRARFHLKQKDRAYVEAKGIDTIREHAVDFITKRIAPATPDKDGRQTPMRNHPVFIAQHATATCCRGCVEKWHHVPKGIPLSDNEICMVVDIIMAWIDTEMNHNEEDT